MNRTTWYRLSYGLVLAALLGIFWLAMTRTGEHQDTLALGLIALFFLSARIPGIFWRELHRGRRLLDAGQPEASLPHFERFLVQVREKPWLKSLIWLGWGAYTRDVEAMAENNLGAAHLNLGRFDEAQRHLQRAIALDGLYPVPYWNLAILAQCRGEAEQAAAYRAGARTRGYANTSLDGLTHAAGAVLGRLEGPGAGPGRKDGPAGP